MLKLKKISAVRKSFHIKILIRCKNFITEKGYRKISSQGT